MHLIEYNNSYKFKFYLINEENKLINEKNICPKLYFKYSYNFLKKYAKTKIIKY